MRDFKKHILRIVEDIEIPSSRCKQFIGGTFKGSGNVDVTFGYIDCGGVNREFVYHLPTNPTPGVEFSFDVFDYNLCVRENSVYKITSFPLFSVVYGEVC